MATTPKYLCVSLITSLSFRSDTELPARHPACKSLRHAHTHALWDHRREALHQLRKRDSKWKQAMSEEKKKGCLRKDVWDSLSLRYLRDLLLQDGECVSVIFIFLALSMIPDTK